MSRFQFVVDHRDAFEVKWLCEVLGIHRSSFYAWLAAAPARDARAQADADLAARIRTLHDADNTLGAPRITPELNAQTGERVNRKRVARVMREQGIRGYTKRRGVRTTIHEQSQAKVPDLLERDFTAPAPNLRYVGDINYLPIADSGGGGNLYLATVIDCFSRRLVGWSIADHMRTELVEDALNAAALTRGSLDGAVFHSDHGSVGDFNRSSQHLDRGGVQWDDRGSSCRRRRTGRGGSGPRIERCGRRCVRRGGLSRRGLCSGSSGA